MRPGHARAIGLAAALLLVCAPASAQHAAHGSQDAHAAHGAQDPHAQHKQAAAKPSEAEGVQIRLEDTRLVDQDGQDVRLKSDVAAGRIVVVGFVYTSCTTICPVISALFADLQSKLGPALGREVRLVSVTVDPLRDTPRRLKDYAAKFDAGPEWRWLTGRKAEVDEVLKAFGAYTPNYLDHPPLVVVGDARTGQWKRFYGFPAPDKVLSVVEALRAGRMAGHHHHGS